YVVHKRLYLLVAGGRGWGADHPDVQKFLQSFELSPAVAAVDPAKEPDPAKENDPFFPRPGKPPPPPPPAPIQPAMLTRPGISSDWQVIFRSHDPAMWNQDVTRTNTFAKSLANVGNIRYLRLRNDSDYVIVQTTKERLREAHDDGRFGWNGLNENHCAANHL